MDVTNPEEYKRVLRREAAKSAAKPAEKSPSRNGFLRVIGGSHRSRKILFKIDEGTRPMKDRTREAIFNLLGHTIENSVAIDLFGGTGVLGFESVSRGAVFGIIVEKDSFRSHEVIENAKRIDMAECCRVFHGDAFRISHNPNKLVESCVIEENGETLTWNIFCCPPYKMWTDQPTKLVDLVERWMERCPVGSNIVIELETKNSDEFQFESEHFEWIRRDYEPATIAIGTKNSA
jgi:16S rRNA (guanine966-N2)-methyltransferase